MTPSHERPHPPHLTLKQAVKKAMENERESRAHQLFRAYPGHDRVGINREAASAHPDEDTMPGIVSPGATGVIYCSDRAMANGFKYEDPAWANLGQGAPEVGPLPDAPPRPEAFTFPPDSFEYGPTTGIRELREAVAKLYNETYRKGKPSQYTADNVCIVPGGRAGLSRVAAVIGDVYTGYQIPDYSAYSEMLGVFKRLVPIPTALKAENKYSMNLQQTKDDINHQGLQIILASNPRNPTGQAIKGDELKELVEISRGKTTVILDEFYSWYLYPEPGKENEFEFGESLSAAKYIDDVNKEHVVIIDGLTKASPHGYIASELLQVAAIPLLDPDHVHKERIALQKHFLAKRDHVLARLEKMGICVAVPPIATFYIWLDLSCLPPPLDNGLTFFEELLKEKTICVPGIFFDLNPAHRRDLFASPCHHFVRLSFGPPLDQLDKGLDAIERVLSKAKNEGMGDIGKDYPLSPTMRKIPDWAEDKAEEAKDEGKSLIQKITSVVM
ncbi:hypothetical protein FRC04_010144 [Tulasnella sp. 424]|nr:hypothetical protein FRC04_010144 [Tulasnella sp. 424]KAG8972551.1 hypothetical protein FRC05_009784 [Tulasnella sp. 425]